MDYRDYLAGQPMTHCWLRGKKDLIGILLSKVTKTKNITRRKSKILNVGSGSGYDLEVLNKYGDVYVIDVNRKVLSLIPRNLCVEKKYGDACKIPYKSDFFDLVVSFDVLEHIKNDLGAAKEIRRVLKKNGCLVFSVPAFQSLFSSHDRVLGHKRRYSKRGLKRLLSQFHSIYLNYWNSILFPLIAMLRILKKKSSEADYNKFPEWLHSVFYFIFKIENNLIKNNVHLPIGLSIIGYCKK